ncbi:MAG: M56 family metallopeptidase [Planctomycetota bacterium]|jgi:WD40 repeat protein/beta-lactamase regulating signal transducer with metallopeptidase domain
MNALQAVIPLSVVQYLGWALVYSVWQIALVATLFGITRWWLRNSPANARYLAGCTAMMLMLALPLVTILAAGRAGTAPGIGLSDLHAQGTVGAPVAPLARHDSVVILPGSDVPQSTQSVQSPPPIESSTFEPAYSAGQPAVSRKESFRSAIEPLLPTAVYIWLAGVLILSIRLLGGWFGLHRLRRVGNTPAAREWQQAISRFKELIGVRRAVQLFESTLVEVPTVVGHLRPVLLFPASAVTGLSPEQIEALLAHELAHIRRHDYLVNLIQTLIETLLFYHPAMWWVSRQIRQEREHCCDDLAVAVCGDRADYARALAMMEGLRVAACQAAMAAGAGSLRSRVKRILGGTPRGSYRQSAWVAGALLVSACFGVTIGLYAASNRGNDQQQSDAVEATEADDESAVAALKRLGTRLALDDEAQTVGPLEGTIASDRESTARTDLYGDSLPDGALARMGTVRLHHRGHALGVAFSPDGKTLASHGADKTIRFWDVRSGKLVDQLSETDRRPVFATAFSPDGTQLASLTGTGRLELWNLATRKPAWNVAANRGTRGGTDFGYAVFIGLAVAFAPDGKTVATAGGAFVGMANSGGTVHLWDAATGAELCQFATDVPGDGGHTVAISPDGKVIASGTLRGTIRLWNLQTGEVLAVVKHAHSSAVNSLAFLPDGAALVSGGNRSWREPLPGGGRVSRFAPEIRLWEVPTGRRLGELKMDESDLGGSAIAISPDGRLLASTHHDKIRMWDLASRKPIREISDYEKPYKHRHQQVAFSPDGTMLAAVGYDNTVRVWEVATGKSLLGASEGHRRAVDAIAYSPADQIVATLSYDRTVRLWDPPTGREIRKWSFPGTHLDMFQTLLAFSPDGRTLFSGKRALKSWGPVTSWDSATGSLIRKITLPDQTASVAFSPDGKLIAAATWDWGIQRGYGVFDRDGRMIRENPKNSMIHVVDVDSGEELARFSANGTEAVVGMALSPDGKTLITASDDWRFRRWDIAEGKPVAEFPIVGHQCRLERKAGFLSSGLGMESLSSAVFSRDAAIAVTTCWADDIVIAWDLRTGKQPATIQIRGEDQDHLTISPDGRMLATVSPYYVLDPSIRLWELATGRQLAEFHCQDAIPGPLAFSPNGKVLVSTTDKGTALSWDVTPAYGKLER